MPLMMKELIKDLNSRELLFPPLLFCFQSVAMSVLLIIQHAKNGFGIQFFEIQI